MVFEIIIGAILIAFGFLGVLFSIENNFSDTKLIGVFIIGILAILAGLWSLALVFTWAVVITKIVGIIIFLFGLFLLFGFPDVTRSGVGEYQPFGMAKFGVFLGIILMIAGIFLIIL